MVPWFYKAIGLYSLCETVAILHDLSCNKICDLLNIVSEIILPLIQLLLSCMSFLPVKKELKKKKDQTKSSKIVMQRQT